MEKYLVHSADVLDEMLATSTDFKERQHIRGALRELKGLKLEEGTAITYSFSTDSVKRILSPRDKGNESHTRNSPRNESHPRNSPRSSPRKYGAVRDESRSTYSPRKYSAGREENVQGFGEKSSWKNSSSRNNENSPRSSDVDVRKHNLKSNKSTSNEQIQKFRSYLYAGNLKSSESQGTDVIHESAKLADNGKVASEKDNNATRRPVSALSLLTIPRNLDDVSPYDKEKTKVLRRPVSLSLSSVGGDKSSEKVTSPNSRPPPVPRKPKKIISYRTSPFSSSSTSPFSPKPQTSPNQARISLTSPKLEGIRSQSAQGYLCGTSSSVSPRKCNIFFSNMKSDNARNSVSDDIKLMEDDSVFESNNEINERLSEVVSGERNINAINRNVSDSKMSHQNGYNRDSASTDEIGKENIILSRTEKCECDVTEGQTTPRKKSTLTRKKRVSSDSYKERLASHRSKDDAQDSPRIHTHSDSVHSGSKSTDLSPSVALRPLETSIDVSHGLKAAGEEVDKSANAETVKTPRRKLPDRPASDTVEDDETVHARTMRLLQERKKDRHKKTEPLVTEPPDKSKNTNDRPKPKKSKSTSDKSRRTPDKPRPTLDLSRTNHDKSKTTPDKSKLSPTEIKKILEEKLERSDSKKKSVRVRRELQLLNRENELKSPKPGNISDQIRPLSRVDSAHEKGNGSRRKLVQRSKSDIVKSGGGGNIVVGGRGGSVGGLGVGNGVGVGDKTVDVDVVDGNSEEFKSQLLEKLEAEPVKTPLSPESKINIIGSLMQEEAKLQEMLRKSSNFSEKRKMRAEIKKLREKRVELENFTQQPSTEIRVKRCASVTAGLITPATLPPDISNINNKCHLDMLHTPPTLNDLRKQLSETTDYEEKKKIRLALRHLRQQQSRDGSVTQTGLQRSQSFVQEKSPQPVCNGDLGPGDPAVTLKVARSQSVTDKLQNSQNTTNSANVTAHRDSGQLNGHVSNTDRELGKPSEQTGKVIQYRQANASSNKQNTNSLSQRDREHLKSGRISAPLPQQATSSSRESAKQVTQVRSVLQRPVKTKTVDKNEPISLASGSLTRKHSIDSINFRQKSEQDGKKKLLERCKFFESDVKDSTTDQTSKPKPSSILISRGNLTNNRATDRILPATTVPSDNNKATEQILTSSVTTQLEAKKRDFQIKNDVLDRQKPHHIKPASETKGYLGDHDDVEAERKVSPSLLWLEDKRKSLPTIRDIDKLMSTMDIEAAFSEILDAVDTDADNNGDIINTPSVGVKLTADSPIVEEEASESSSINEELEAIENQKNAENSLRMNAEIDNKTNHDSGTIANAEHDLRTSVDNDNKASHDSGIIANAEHDMRTHVDTDNKTNHDSGIIANGVSAQPEISEEVIVKQVAKKDETEQAGHKIEECNNNNDKSAITQPGIKTSEATIQLHHSNLSLDLSPKPTTAGPESNSAISVIHGDDGTVTVQEVNKHQEGDTTITEWKKIRRTQSRTETRETDTVKEKNITSPGGSSTVYEKDVSKTKKKLTSRGSEYFQTNNYNIKRVKDPEGAETVLHELSSESKNLSVSKNESWGDRSEATVVLNRDSEEGGLKMVEESRLPQLHEGGQDTTKAKPKKSVTRTTSMCKIQLSNNTKTTPSSVDDGADSSNVLEASLGRPSGCPNITSPLSDLCAEEGSTARLECVVRCSPPPTMQWMRAGARLFPSDDTRFGFDGVSGRAWLELCPVSMEHVGDYKCEFENERGSAATKAKVAVKAKPGDPPSFQSTLEDVCVREGQSLTLQCMVAHADTVTWYKDGVIQPSNPDFRQTFDGRAVTMEISELFLDDSGTYMCVLRSKAGEAKSACEIEVTEAESTHEVYPAFLKKPETQIVDEQDTAIFECDIIGSPVPDISWLLDGTQLTENGQNMFSYDGRVARLIIKQVSMLENGKIECVAANSCGRVVADCLLVVKAVKPEAQIITALDDVTVISGKVAILECGIVGSAADDITWTKNGCFIGKAFDFRQTYMNDVARLEIANVCKADSGLYECTVAMDTGSISSSCMLTIEDKPVIKPEVKPEVKQEIKAEVKAEVKVEAKPEVKPEVTPTEPQLTVQEEKVQTASVKKFPARFVPKVAEDQVKVARSQASKVMLVRQGSWRGTPANDKAETPLKRSGSWQSRSPRKMEKPASPQHDKSQNDPTVCVKAAEVKVNLNHETKAELKLDLNQDKKVVGNSSNEVKTVTKSSPEVKSISTLSQEVKMVKPPSPEVKTSGDSKLVVELRQPKTVKADVDHNENAVSSASANVKSLPEVRRDKPTPVVRRDSLTIDSKLVAELRQPKTVNTDVDYSEKPPSLARRDSLTIDSKLVAELRQPKTDVDQSERPPPLARRDSLTIDHEPFKQEKDAFKLERETAQVDNETVEVERKTLKAEREVANMEDETVQEEKQTFTVKRAKPKTETESVKLDRSADKKAETVASKMSVNLQSNKVPMCSVSKEDSDIRPKMKLKVGGEIRRTQSVRTAGSEKPEWLQVKLRSVGSNMSPLAATDKLPVDKTAMDKSPVDKSQGPSEPAKEVKVEAAAVEQPVVVRRAIKVSRSQSARIPDKPALRDSTNSPSNDPNKSVPKLTPVSERAKLFQNSGRSSPVDIIAKALGRAESMRSPAGRGGIGVQRSHSFKTIKTSPSTAGDVTLDLTPQQSKGSEEQGGLGSSPAAVNFWERSTVTANMANLSSIHDEAQLNAMLSATQDFDERKKIRGRLKELRDVVMQEWEERQKAAGKPVNAITRKHFEADLEKQKKMAAFQDQAKSQPESHAAPKEDPIKKKHREAELEKQKKLAAFNAQAKEQAEANKPDMAEEHRRQRQRDADAAKQRQMAAFDKMAKKDDVSQTSTVTTNISKDGSTVTTTRRTETVTKVGGAGARPGAEHLAPAMLQQVINATSPLINGGSLTVKTESWSSKDGQTNASEKTESWGGPAGRGRGGAKNMFQQMDAKTNPPGAGAPRASNITRSPSAIKTMLLEWTKAMTREYVDTVEITNFSTSWNDGMAFCALIHHFYPEAFDFGSLDPKQRRKNFDLAFDTAEKYADIAPLLDTEDMVRMKKPDWKCVFTYVQSFYRKLQKHERNVAAAP